MNRSPQLADEQRHHDGLAMANLLNEQSSNCCLTTSSGDSSSDSTATTASNETAAIVGATSYRLAPNQHQHQHHQQQQQQQNSAGCFAAAAGEQHSSREAQEDDDDDDDDNDDEEEDAASVRVAAEEEEEITELVDSRPDKRTDSQLTLAMAPPPALTNQWHQQQQHQQQLTGRPKGGEQFAQPSHEEVKQVELFGVGIVALTINGKDRLCLAQISNTLLKEFSYNEIHNRRVALGITCIQCTPIQLEMLRRAGAMPSSSRRCGMITMREAERLCRSFLVEEQPPELPENFYFTVAHQVNYGCKGRFVPARYISSRAKCIECFYCGEFYSPNKFIFHSHRQPNNTDCNPPDSPNINSWRKHIDLDWSQEQSQEIRYAWEDVKSLFNGGTRRRAHPSASAAAAAAAASAGSAGESGGGHHQRVAPVAGQISKTGQSPANRHQHRGLAAQASQISTLATANATAAAAAAAAAADEDQQQQQQLLIDVECDTTPSGAESPQPATGLVEPPALPPGCGRTSSQLVGSAHKHRPAQQQQQQRPSGGQHQSASNKRPHQGQLMMNGNGQQSNGKRLFSGGGPSSSVCSPSARNSLMTHGNELAAMSSAVKTGETRLDGSGGGGLFSSLPMSVQLQQQQQHTNPHALNSMRASMIATQFGGIDFSQAAAAAAASASRLRSNQGNNHRHSTAAATAATMTEEKIQNHHHHYHPNALLQPTMQQQQQQQQQMSNSSAEANFIHSQLYGQLMLQPQQHQLQQKIQQALPEALDAQLALRHHIWTSLLANLQCNFPTAASGPIADPNQSAYGLSQQQQQQQRQPAAASVLQTINQSLAGGRSISDLTGANSACQSQTSLNHLLASYPRVSSTKLSNLNHQATEMNLNNYGDSQSAVNPFQEMHKYSNGGGGGGGETNNV